VPGARPGCRKRLYAWGYSDGPAQEGSAARTDEEVTPFSITIESIELTDSTLRFANYSLPLPFSTSIHTLNGQISTLNSTSDQPARVDLEGQVAEYGLARTDLLPPQRERIAKLREALNQRPALALELAGPFSRNFDGPALQREKAIETLRQRLAGADREIADPSLTAESNQSIVETMFSSYYPETDLEAVQTRFTEKQNESSDGAGLDALVDPNADASIATDRVRLLDPKKIDSVDGERIAMKVGITAD